MRSNSDHHPSLSRRHFLSGLGVCVALPGFESLGLARPLIAAPAARELAATATGAPLRTAFVYFPNGAIPKAWWPTETGGDFQLKGSLAPLEPYRKSIQVLKGLNHRTADGGPDGAGDHARGNGTFLTGVRLKKSATDIRAGISIDQVIAGRVGQMTRFPSLELATDAIHRAGACDSGYACAYQYNLAWSSPTTPVTPETNPRLVFERLFGSGAPGQRRTNQERRRLEQRSVLDFVLGEARSMQRRLVPADKDKLDQYLTGVRELETRIEKVERFGEAADPAIDTPVGIPADYAEYIQLMYDLLVLAFQTDSTRVATLMLAHDGSNRSFEHIGIVEGHHDLSHHRNRQEWIDKVADIDQWYVQQFAIFLDKLGKVKDADGHSLLHNSMIVYGSGNADGNRHTHDNLPFLLAGGGGGTLTPGRYVKHGSKPASNLFLSIADRVGIEGLRRFGDSTGPISDV
jgi:Protein of unknown function (DUF1552)